MSNSRIQLSIHNISVPKPIDHIPSCFDDIILTICTAYKLEYYPMFAASYSFLNDYKVDHYYKRIYVRNRNSELLYQCSGLRYKFYSMKNNLLDFSTIMEELYNKRPIIVHFDSFYCPWDKLKGKLHNEHMVLITGIDSVQKMVFVCDPWFDKEEWIPSDILMSACEFYALLSFETPITITFDDRYLIDNLCSSVRGNGANQDVFENIKDFGRRLLTDFDYTDIDSENFFDSSFYKILQTVLYSRCEFLSFLQYMIPNSSIINRQLCIEFKQSILSWRIIQRMFAKAYIQKLQPQDSFLKSISNLIISIANDEKMFLQNKIIDPYEGKQVISACVRKNQFFSDLQNIDLSEILNNKAFDYLDGRYNANFTGKGTFFVLDNKDDVNNVFLENIDMHIFDNIKNEFDNVVCGGQELTINKVDVSRVFICGCSEFGNYTDYWKFVDYQNNVTYHELSFSDHSTPPRNGEKVVYTSDIYIHAPSGTKFVRTNCNIFAIELNLECRQDIKKIVFPNCPCTHIFSVIIL